MANKSELKLAQESLELLKENISYLEGFIDTTYYESGVRKNEEKAASTISFLKEDGRWLDAKNFDVEAEDDGKHLTYDEALILLSDEEGNLIENLSEESEKEVILFGIQYLNALDVLFESRRELKQATTDMQNAKVSYMKFMGSEKYAVARKERIKKIKEHIEKEANIYKKAEMKKQLEVYEAIETFSYLKKPFEKNAAKERDYLVSSYFDKTKGSYLLERFGNKCKQLKLDSNIIQYLSALEERFLDESYGPANNLFLWACVKYIAYADISGSVGDKAFCFNIFENLYLLVAEKYETAELKNKMINVMKVIDDNFINDEATLEMLKKENRAWKEHPWRIEREKEEKEMKEKIEAELAERKQISRVIPNEWEESLAISKMGEDFANALGYGGRTKSTLVKADVEIDSMEYTGKAEILVVNMIDNGDYQVACVNAEEVYKEDCELTDDEKEERKKVMVPRIEDAVRLYKPELAEYVETHKEG